jgi:hypothetical protein
LSGKPSSPLPSLDELRSKLFDLDHLHRFTLTQQRLKSKAPVRSTSHLTVEENEALIIRPPFQPTPLEIDSYPDLKRTTRDDPDDVGTRKRVGFDDDGKLIRKPPSLPPGRPNRTICLAWRASLGSIAPHPALAPSSSIQLARTIHQTRLRFLARLCNARARDLRDQGCLVFRSAAAYGRHLYCPPTEAEPSGKGPQSFDPRCDLPRLCPWCWTRQYITQVFFAFRYLMTGRKPDSVYRKMRSDRKLIVVRQDWKVPQSTHLFDIMADLQERRGQLYAEIPKASKLLGLAQLQYIEPPLRRNEPWFIRRRAIIVADATHPPFALMSDGHLLRNDSRTHFQVTQKTLAVQLGRLFTYPLAMQLAPLNLVRRLLDAQVLWPYDRSFGFQIFNSRGQIRRANQESMREYHDRYYEES